MKSKRKGRRRKRKRGGGRSGRGREGEGEGQRRYDEGNRREEEHDSRFKNFNKKNIIELVVDQSCINHASIMHQPPLNPAPRSHLPPIIADSFANHKALLCNNVYDKRKSRASCDLDLLGLLSLGAKERKNLCFRRRMAAAADGAGMEE